ncbi:hypothetical protein LINPERPRIM_LOCUS5362 [Linum perenne]
MTQYIINYTSSRKKERIDSQKSSKMMTHASQMIPVTPSQSHQFHLQPSPSPYHHFRRKHLYYSKSERRTSLLEQSPPLPSATSAKP